jgi:N-acetylmuramoyl-L-alanine amidase
MAGRMVKALPSKLPLAVRPLGLAPLNLLATADTPAIFVETGFLSNPGDAAVLAGAEARQALAQGLAQAVLAVAQPGDRP